MRGLCEHLLGAVSAPTSHGDDFPLRPVLDWSSSD
jgi:hypothetical protein